MTGGLLHQMELLDVAGDGSLRGVEAAFLQLLQQLFLRLHGLLLDDLKQNGLTVIFHAWLPPFPFLNPVSRKSSFWRAAPALW